MICVSPLSIFFQRLHMIKMYLVSFRKRGTAMDLRKFYHDTDKLFLTSNLQVFHLRIILEVFS